MSASNVRSVEALETFQAGIVKLASEWDLAAQEICTLMHRVEQHFDQERPAYWRRQTQLAERELASARDQLASLRFEMRPGQSQPATEAAQRVVRAEQRLKLCQDKERRAKVWAIEIAQQADALLGPLADVTEHCQVVLPEAARELRLLIDRLRIYTETAPSTPTAPPPDSAPASQPDALPPAPGG